MDAIERYLRFEQRAQEDIVVLQAEDGEEYVLARLDVWAERSKPRL